MKKICCHVVRRLTTVTLMLGCVSTLLLAGCSKAPKADQTAQGDVPPACRGNPYLMRYGCSLKKVQTAAINGNPDAQYALGYMYYYGIRTPRDPQSARLWINRAAVQGQPLAQRAQRLLGNPSGGGGVRRSYYSRPSGSTTPSRSTGSNSASRASSSDIQQMNNRTPNEPMTNHLPNYGQPAPGSATNPSAATPPGQAPSTPESMPPSSALDRHAPSRTAHQSHRRYAHKAAKAASYPRSSESARNHAAQSAAFEGATEPAAPHSASNRTAAGAVNAASATNASAQGASSRSNYDTDEKTLLGVSSAYYAIQLLGSHDARALQSFVDKHKLQDHAWTYSTRVNNGHWYMLVYGKYSNSAEAHAAISKLPRQLRKLHPWIKSYRVIHREIKTRRLMS